MIRKSYATIGLCLGIIAGTFLGPNLTTPHWTLIVINILLILATFKKSRPIFYLLILNLGIFIGLFRYTGQQQFINNCSNQNFTDNSSGIMATVSTFSSQKNNTQQFIVSPSTETTNKDCQILVATSPFPTYSPTDKILITGEISKPENFSDDFSYTGYLAAKHVYYQIKNAKTTKLFDHQFQPYKIIAIIRNDLLSLINKLYLPPASSLAGGILLGNKQDLPTELNNSLRKSGLSHIVVASGYNLTILAGILYFLLRGKFALKLIVAILLLLLISFCIITGFESSIARALVMTTLLIIAPLFGRKSNPSIAILLAATIMILINPLILWYDPGFHLSFLATIGMLYITPILELLINKNKSNLISGFTTTMSAIIITAPYTAYNFHQLSLIAPLANIIILPLVPPAMLLVALSLPVSIIFPYLISSFIILPSTILLKTILYLSTFFGSLSFSSIEIFVSLKSIVIYYLILITIIIFFHKYTKNKSTNNVIIQSLSNQ